MQDKRPAGHIEMVYDSDCPICNMFACSIRGAENVTLIDGRLDSDLLELAKAKKLNIDTGSIVRMNGKIYHGTEAFHVVAQHVKTRGLVGFLNRNFFRFRSVAKITYPVFVSTRRLLLAILRRPLINSKSIVNSTVSAKGSCVSDRKTQRSQRFFNPVSLAIYDFALYKIVSPLLWGCTEQFLVQRYKFLCGSAHLEVGVGTGRLLDRADLSNMQLGIVDLSEACIRKASRRLHRYYPKTWRRNILKPIELDTSFDSISINYVMHCVVGSFAEKGCAFKHVKTLLNPNGVLFGASVLKTPQSHILARMFMKALNLLGVFNNGQDNAHELESALRRDFCYVEVQLRGSTALFLATDDEKTFSKYRN